MYITYTIIHITVPRGAYIVFILYDFMTFYWLNCETWNLICVFADNHQCLWLIFMSCVYIRQLCILIKGFLFTVVLSSRDYNLQGNVIAFFQLSELASIHRNIPINLDEIVNIYIF